MWYYILFNDVDPVVKSLVGSNAKFAFEHTSDLSEHLMLPTRSCVVRLLRYVISNRQSQREVAVTGLRELLSLRADYSISMFPLGKKKWAGIDGFHCTDRSPIHVNPDTELELVCFYRPA